MAVVGSSRTWRLVALSVLLLGAMGLYELRVSQLDPYRPGSVHHVSLDTGRRESCTGPGRVTDGSGTGIFYNWKTISAMPTAWLKQDTIKGTFRVGGHWWNELMPPHGSSERPATFSAGNVTVHMAGGREVWDDLSCGVSVPAN
jgi:hypothetical protein